MTELQAHVSASTRVLESLLARSMKLVPRRNYSHYLGRRARCVRAVNEDHERITAKVLRLIEPIFSLTFLENVGLVLVDKGNLSPASALVADLDRA